MTSHYYKYLQYLKSKEWKAVRLDVIQMRVCCERCGSIKKLEVHHKTYERLFNENPSDLELLCHSCHRKHHKDEKKGVTPKKKKRFKKRRIKTAAKRPLHDYSISAVTNIKVKRRKNNFVSIDPDARQKILDMLNKKSSNLT